MTLVARQPGESALVRRVDTPAAMAKAIATPEPAVVCECKLSPCYDNDRAVDGLEISRPLAVRGKNTIQRAQAIDAAIQKVGYRREPEPVPGTNLRVCDRPWEGSYARVSFSDIYSDEQDKRHLDQFLSRSGIALAAEDVLAVRDAFVKAHPGEWGGPRAGTGVSVQEVTDDSGALVGARFTWTAQGYWDIESEWWSFYYDAAAQALTVGRFAKTVGQLVDGDEEVFGTEYDWYKLPPYQPRAKVDSAKGVPAATPAADAVATTPAQPAPGNRLLELLRRWLA